MALSTYSGIKSAIANWLDRDESTITSELDDFIDLAEERIYGDKELRKIRPLQTALSGTIASGVLAVPSDYLALDHAYIVQGNQYFPMERKTPEWIFANYPDRSASSRPLYIARSAENFIFGAYPDSDYTVGGLYYKKLTALSTSNETNWFTTNAPGLILYGALLESAGFFTASDQDLTRWGRGFDIAKERIIRADDDESWSGGPLAATLG